MSVKPKVTGAAFAIATASLVNKCKGNNDCKTESNACKGHGSCKGQGFVSMSEKACDKLGGKVGT